MVFVVDGCSSSSSVSAVCVCVGEAAVVSGLGAAAGVAVVVVDGSEGVRAPRRGEVTVRGMRRIVGATVSTGAR